MRKIIIAFSLLVIAACTKSNSTSTAPVTPVTPVSKESFLTVTVGGRTAYEKYLGGSTTKTWDLKAFSSTSYLGSVATTHITVEASGDSSTIQKDVSIHLYCKKSGTGIGTYKACFGNPDTYNGTDILVDFVNGPIYTIDTTSTITISQNDTAYIAGTFNFNLYNYLGNYTTATGSFKIITQK